jgi:hypothetical protein
MNRKNRKKNRKTKSYISPIAERKHNIYSKICENILKKYKNFWLIK